MIGWLTSNAEMFLIGWLIGSGLIVFVRGVLGSTREYALSDAIFGVIEIAFLIWLVTVVAR
jgi:hypothetical protein